MQGDWLGLHGNNIEIIEYGRQQQEKNRNGVKKDLKLPEIIKAYFQPELFPGHLSKSETDNLWRPAEKQLQERLFRIFSYNQIFLRQGFILNEVPL